MPALFPITIEDGRRHAELQQIALADARQGDTQPLSGSLESGLCANPADAWAQSFLKPASTHGHLGTARLLLKHGAGMDRPDAHGQPLLGRAAGKGHPDIAALLPAHGADLSAGTGHKSA